MHACMHAQHELVRVLLPLSQTFLAVFFCNHMQIACHVGNIFNCVKSLAFHHLLESGEEPEVTKWQVREWAGCCDMGMFTCQKPLDRKWCVAGCIIVKEHPNILPILQALPLDWLSQMLQELFLNKMLNWMSDTGNQIQNGQFHVEEWNQQQKLLSLH